MQLSRFATNIKIDEDDYMLYSLKTRQYYPYKKEAHKSIQSYTIPPNIFVVGKSGSGGKRSLPLCISS